MPGPNRTEALLRELSAKRLPAEERAQRDARRELLLPRLRSAVESAYVKQQRVERLRVRGAVASALAIAAAAALYIAGPALSPEPSAGSSKVLALAGSVGIIHDQNESEAPPLQSVVVGASDEVVTAAAGGARATMESGAEVEIGPASRVRLLAAPHGARTTRAEESVDLASGRVLVRVPKLGPARSFAVRTLDTTVVVHGTVFSVERSVGATGRALTRVDVEQGSVAVRHGGVEVLLQTGDHWSSEPLPLDASEQRVPASDPVDVASPDEERSDAPAGRADARGSKASTLAAQNRLLKGAMEARHEGDARRALELADRLMRRYPSSPLLQEARVERLRAVVALQGRAAGAAEARRYLADYPDGFARREASEIAAHGSP